MNIIIILNYNDYETTFNLLNQIQNYHILDKIIVVDNCSTDNSYEKLMVMQGNKIDIILCSKNLGYAYGNNYGMKFAFANYNPKNFIISNPDILFLEEDLGKILKVLDSGENIGIVTGRIHDLKNELISNWAWRVPTYKDLLVGCFFTTYLLVRRFFKTSIYLDKKLLEKNDIVETEAVSGCFFSIRSEVFRDIGFFDERTFLYGEENIIAFKLKAGGYKSYVVSKAIITHMNSVSINKNIKKRMKKYKFRLDSEILYLKYYLRSSKFMIFIYRIVFYIGVMEKWLFSKYLLLVK
ncbi:MAG: glycosyltransferase family 2 protein [Eubacteriales bacterium]|nr:glycosyltransferase family 2 protein [Eubacteriales bacterium]